MGLLLEALHGFKVRWYLDQDNETRRLMWTLAHAHGTLVALIQFAFAGVVRMCSAGSCGWRKVASPLLLASGLLLPLGFFLGGVATYAGDPGVGVLLTPLGALALLVAILVTAVGASFPDDSDDSDASETNE